MRVFRNILVSAVAIVAATFGGWVAAAPAQAESGRGHVDVYQLSFQWTTSASSTPSSCARGGRSSSCDLRSRCGTKLGGFRGHAELHHDRSSGVNTGRAEFSGCSQGRFKGASHTRVEVTDWWTGNGSAGPKTLFTDQIDTTRFHGTKTVETFNGVDAGISLVPGHQSSRSPGVHAPAGTTFWVRISLRRAH